MKDINCEHSTQIKIEYICDMCMTGDWCDTNDPNCGNDMMICVDCGKRFIMH